MNAIMIMCHKNANQIIKLAKRCTSKNNIIFIHADEKMDDKEYNSLCNISKTCHNIFICKKRIHGVLDTRSLVDIAMIMIEEAKDYEKKMNIKIKYYLLLSGQDYPIKNISYIDEQLSNTYPKPYIDCTPYDKNNWISYKFKYSYTGNLMSTKISMLPKRSILRYFMRFIEFSYKFIIGFFEPSAYKYLIKHGYKLYGGSAWWILPDMIINYVLNIYNENSKYIRQLLFSYTPEETFFQTVIMNSPYKNLVEINGPSETKQNCKTWAYFTDIDKPFKGHPYIFTVNELNKLLNSNKWFARKFDINVDKEIFDLLDSNIENGEKYEKNMYN